MNSTNDMSFLTNAYHNYFSHNCELYFPIYCKHNNTRYLQFIQWAFAILRINSHYCKLYLLSFLYKVDKLIPKIDDIFSLSSVVLPYFFK